MMLGRLPVSAWAAKAFQLAIAVTPPGRVRTKSRRFTSAIILIPMRFFQLLLLAHVVPLAAQSVKIYSEVQRIDPFGQIVPIDRSDHPREILSPALLRNAHSTFHI